MGVRKFRATMFEEFPEPIKSPNSLFPITSRTFGFQDFDTMEAAQEFAGLPQFGKRKVKVEEVNLAPSTFELYALKKRADRSRRR